MGEQYRLPHQIDQSGRVYTANGKGGGKVYDSNTGQLLGDFGVDDPQYQTSAIASMVMDDQGQLYLADQTGT